MVYTIVVHLYAKAGEENISKLSAKLIEASRVYSKDRETISWFVMQDTKDPRAFTIVERYEQESVSWNPRWLSTGCQPVVFADDMAESEISPREPLLANIRSLCYPIVGEANGSQKIWRVRH